MVCQIVEEVNVELFTAIKTKLITLIQVLGHFRYQGDGLQVIYEI